MRGLRSLGVMVALVLAFALVMPQLAMATTAAITSIDYTDYATMTWTYDDGLLHAVDVGIDSTATVQPLTGFSGWDSCSIGGIPYGEHTFYVRVYGEWGAKSEWYSKPFTYAPPTVPTPTIDPIRDFDTRYGGLMFGWDEPAVPAGWNGFSYEFRVDGGAVQKGVYPGGYANFLPNSSGKHTISMRNVMDRNATIYGADRQYWLGWEDDVIHAPGYEAVSSPWKTITVDTFASGVKKTMSAAHAPTSARKNKSFSVWATISPKQSKNTYLQLRCYRKEKQSNGTYKYILRKTVKPNIRSYSSTATKMYRTFSLPSKGKWKVVPRYTGTSKHVDRYGSADYIIIN